MTQIIQDLSRLLRKAQAGEVASQGADLLVTLRISDHRQQSVKVSLEYDEELGCSLLRLQSRATVAKSYKTLHSALVTNANAEWGGLCLDPSTEPPAVDVRLTIVADDVEFETFYAALHHVALYADTIERRTLQDDTY